MGLSKYPLLILAVSGYLLYTAATKYKKERKPLIVTYVLLAIAGIFVALQRVGSTYFSLSEAYSNIINALVGAFFFAGLVAICYTAWTSEKRTRLSKPVLIVLSCLIVAALLIIIALYMYIITG